MKYILDTNVFIQAYRFYYPFDIFPVFWKWLKEKNSSGLVCSLDMVRDEIKYKNDPLSVWCDKLDKDSWFLPSDDESTQYRMSSIANWVMQKDFKEHAKSDFLNCADPWLIAKAKSDDLTVITQEKSDPKSKKKIFIPDVCDAFGVYYMNTIDLLRKLGAEF